MLTTCCQARNEELYRAVAGMKHGMYTVLFACRLDRRPCSFCATMLGCQQHHHDFNLSPLALYKCTLTRRSNIHGSLCEVAN